jgi:DNA-binding MarR family transcriptional regulator
VIVQLTPRALELIDELMTGHLANEARLFATLSTEEREQLAGALRSTLHALGDTTID